MYILLLVALTANGCTVNLTAPDGSPVTFDLSQMERDENYVRDYIYQGDEEYDYFANICGETTMNCGWTGTAVAIQKTKGSVCVSTLAKTMGDEIEGEWLDENDPGVGVKIIFRDGDDCGEIPRTTIFNLYCSKGRTELTYAGENMPGTCMYTFDYNTPVVCGGISGYSGGGGSSSSPSSSSPSSSYGVVNSGYSYGTYFLIGLVCLTILYCVGGIYLNKKHAEEDISIKEAIPHVEFWKSVPGLAADGVRFTITKVKTIISSGNPTESTL